MKKSSTATLLRKASLIHCRARNASIERPRVAHVTIVMMLVLSSVVLVVVRGCGDVVLGMFMMVKEEERPPTDPTRPRERRKKETKEKGKETQ